MKLRPAIRPPHGFTLVELLIALAIMALLSLLGYRAIASLADTEVQLTHESQRWRALDFFLARLEGDCRQAVPRAARVGADLQPAFYAGRAADGNAFLVVSRAGPEFVLEPASAGQRIGYRLRNGVVEILYWSGYDLPADAVPAAYPLVGGVSGMAIAYLDSRGAWRERWPVFGEPVLPRGLRITLDLADGARIERLIALQ